ncbi:MAG: permease-like cell division protein FtsX [Acidobacteriota bacterium]|jgi:cell division transport system permease protein|nr:permease-like cell division protein FtsX [Acidobacteriota bacterium]
MKRVEISLDRALRNIWRNKLVSFLCLGIIAFTLMIFGLFEFISHNLDRFTERFSQNVEAIFYLKDDVNSRDVDKLMERLRGNLLVHKVNFKSTQQAQADFVREFPDLEFILAEFDASPFPASLEITFHPQYNFDTKVSALITEISQLPQVESREVNLEWAHKIMTVKRFISLVGAFLSTILIFVSVFIIFNVIKLNILYRREEIYIQELVGATRSYIRFPFVIEGALLGFFGGLFSILLLLATVSLFPSYAGLVFDLLRDMIKVNRIPPTIFLQLLILGTVIGLFSALFALNRFMKPAKES